MSQSLTNRSRLLEKYVQVVREDGLNTNKNVNIGINSTTANLWVSGNITAGGTISSVGGDSLTAPVTITGSSANALAVGLNGSTNPAFNVDTSTASSTSGITVKSSAVNGTVGLTVTDSSSSGTSLSINGLGSSSIILGNTMTAGSVVSVRIPTTIMTSSSQALAVGRQGATSPAFSVDASTGSSITGLNLKAGTTGGTTVLTATDTGSDSSLSIAAKGAGILTFQPAVVASAGGAANSGIQFGSIGVGLFTGTGTPTFSAMNGSIYVDSNATTTTTRMYVNKSGAGTAGTTWTNLTTAA